MNPQEIVRAAVAVTLGICPEKVRDDLPLGCQTDEVLIFIGAHGIARKPLMSSKNMTVRDVFEFVA